MESLNEGRNSVRNIIADIRNNHRNSEINDEDDFDLVRGFQLFRRNGSGQRRSNVVDASRQLCTLYIFCLDGPHRQKVSPALSGLLNKLSLGKKKIKISRHSTKQQLKEKVVQVFPALAGKEFDFLSAKRGERFHFLPVTENTAQGIKRELRRSMLYIRPTTRIDIRDITEDITDERSDLQVENHANQRPQRSAILRTMAVISSAAADIMENSDVEYEKEHEENSIVQPILRAQEIRERRASRLSRRMRNSQRPREQITQFIDAGTPTVSFRSNRVTEATLSSLSQERVEERPADNIDNDEPVQDQNVANGLPNALMERVEERPADNVDNDEPVQDQNVANGLPNALMERVEERPADNVDNDEPVQDQNVANGLPNALMENAHLQKENEFEGLDEDTQTALSLVKSAISVDGDNIKVLRLSRENILTDVLKCYEEEDILSKRLSVDFQSEMGADLGGLTKDMFSVFWKEAFLHFFKGEDALVPYLPLHRRRESSAVFPVLGKILSHMLMLLGELPPKICRSSLWSVLCPDNEVSDELLLEDFLLYVSQSERITLKEALSNGVLSGQNHDYLCDIFRCYGLQVLPNKDKIKSQIIDIARSELLDKPLHLLLVLKGGISSFCLDNFFRKLTIGQLTKFYQTLLPTVKRVLNCFQTEDDVRPEEDVTLFFLKSYVREMNRETLEAFLLFVTGSTMMPFEGIKISFNSSSGSGRSPVAHTCGNVLELPVSYSSYQDFKNEWNLILSNPEAFKMSVL